MINKELLIYVKDEKEKGIADEQIRQILASNNWQESDITQILNIVNAQLNTSPPININPNQTPNNINAPKLFKLTDYEPPYFLKDLIFALGLYLIFLLSRSFHLYTSNLVFWYILYLVFYLRIKKNSLGRIGNRILFVFRIFALESLIPLLSNWVDVIINIFSNHFSFDISYSLPILSTLFSIFSYLLLSRLSSDKEALENNQNLVFLTIGSYILADIISLIIRHILWFPLF